MRYPLVQVTTKDDFLFYGMHLPARSKSVLIAIHGTASNFYENDFMEEVTKAAHKNRISVLLTNNRGCGVLQAWPRLHGTSLEHFEDCVKDIDAWISFALKQGYRKIILQGHSLGSEKVVYYMNKGRYRNKVKAVILLAPSNSWGAEMEYLRKKNTERYFKEARELVEKGKGHRFLVSDWFSYSGVMPKSADSFLNFMEENSELSKALPFHEKKLPLVRKMRVPVLAVIGDQFEWTLIPIREALDLLRKECKAEIHQIKDCDHDFTGKERELAEIVGKFLEKMKAY